ncbi:phosphoglucomutase, partial [Bacillus velezensis]
MEWKKEYERWNTFVSLDIELKQELEEMK